MPALGRGGTTDREPRFGQAPRHAADPQDEDGAWRLRGRRAWLPKGPQGDHHSMAGRQAGGRMAGRCDVGEAAIPVPVMEPTLAAADAMTTSRAQCCTVSPSQIAD